MALSKSEIEAGVERLGPFHHGIELPYGLHTQPEGLSRGEGELHRVRDIQLGAWSALLELFGGTLAGKRVLDVGWKVIGGPNPDNPSTSLWRSEEGTAQFVPTQAAVEKLLQLLGFASVTRLEPHPDQARRYHKGTRMTFVALRTGEGAPGHLFGRDPETRPGPRRVEPRARRTPLFRRLARRARDLRSRG